METVAMASESSFEPGRAVAPAGGPLSDAETVRQPVAGPDPHPTAEMPEVDTGTGWPGAGPARGVEPVRERPKGRTALLDDDDDDDDRSAPRGRRRAGGCLFWLAGAVALIVVIALGAKLTGLWPSFSNPFAKKTTDRSQPTLLLSIQDLARFEAASGNFQEVIDVQQDRKYIPDLIFNDRTLFICVGSVDVYVDFSHIGQGDITDSADHKTASVKLPAAQLEKPNIDHDKSYVFATQQGVINRIGDIFNNNPNKQNELYQLGEQRIAQAARDSGLPQRAQDNTKQMLEQLLKSLGYTTITVTFAAT
jgi:hypothetical protein